MAQSKSSLETFDQLMRGEPQGGTASGNSKPQLPKSEQQRKADATTEAARSLIDAEKEARAAKTERLKSVRLAREAGETSEK